MTLNDVQRAALRKVIRAKLAMWDASLEAENLLGLDVDTGCQSLDDTCAGLDAPDDVESLSDNDLLSAFDLN